MSKPWFAIVDDAPLPVAAMPKGRAAWSDEQKRAVSTARGWTDDSAGRLRTMWKDGDTCAVIATTLSREFDYPYTRNAVIGKVTRLGLPGRIARQRRRQLKKPSAPKPAADRIKLKSDGTVAPYFAPMPLPEEPAVLDPSTNCTLFELQHDSCRWPIGTPGTPEFCFCGGHREHPTPYCTGHANLAYNVRKEQRAKLVATAFDPPDEREAA